MPIQADIDRWRVEALEALYDAVGGDRWTHVNFRELGPSTTLPDDEEAQKTFGWLVDHGLAEWAALGGVIAITADGIDQVEEWKRQEAVPASAPTASVVLDVLELRHLERFLSDLEAALERGDGPDDPNDLAALELTRDSIAAQQRSPKPDRGIVRAGLAAIGRMFEGGVGNVIGTLVVEVLKHIA